MRYGIDRNFWRTYWVVFEYTWMDDRAVGYFRSYAHAEAFKKLLEEVHKAEKSS